MLFGLSLKGITNLIKTESMGIFWDLLQEDKLQQQQAQADSLEERVVHLEDELKKTRSLLEKTLVALEEHIGEDIDGDGKLGR